MASSSASALTATREEKIVQSLSKYSDELLLLDGFLLFIKFAELESVLVQDGTRDVTKPQTFQVSLLLLVRIILLH
tara:strand:+ start:120 stop:347 length:228 start_codon:yes stop_codon:yes gene_type:complete